ncbi:hypothetical protein M0813_17646 [Anaeramoeba flamelloides]|uniref:Phage protein n=1 Tax=Anaeramoeba flamelloides TaxID=1746091 RepID=A0AAV7ZSW1_9EUKA|nr:hypothetical protein M0812_10897 [Anaeramoeba flamelloides]KAJ6248452.1 hypothetical protein M0813_17646 [Anaeramoeba flamelloides]
MSLVKGVFKASEQTKIFPEENTEIVPTKQLTELLGIDDKTTNDKVEKGDEFEQILLELNTVKEQTNTFLTTLIDNKEVEKRLNRKREK